MPIAKNLNIPTGRVDEVRAYIIDIGEPAPGNITINLPKTILVDGGELSPQNRSPQSAIRFKLFLANS